MANSDLVKLLLEDVDGWNRWRQRNPDAEVDLSGADLEQADLVVADLSGANLAGARLVLSNLKAADLRGRT